MAVLCGKKLKTQIVVFVNFCQKTVGSESFSFQKEEIFENPLRRPKGLAKGKRSPLAGESLPKGSMKFNQEHTWRGWGDLRCDFRVDRTHLLLSKREIYSTILY